MLNCSSKRVVIAALSALAVSAAAACGRDSPSRPSTPSALTVNSVSPTIGLSDGATTVRIVGAGFQPGTTVALGDTAMNATVTGTTTITGTAPPHAVGIVDLVVTNPGGQSVRAAGAFSYVQMAVTSVTPSKGIIGDWVRIVGVGFLPGMKVTLDGLQADVLPQNNGAPFALAPVHAEGPVDVVVTNPNGSSSTLPGGFTYQAVAVTAGATVVTAGAQLSVSWVAPPGRSQDDWVGLFKAGETLERWYVYTGGLTSATRTLTAPTDPGQYEFRYLPDDSYNVAARSVTVSVVATPVR